jgi:fibronectin type 3 domain-containing protein
LGGGAGYSVTVLTQPTGQTCTVTNGSGTVASANVTNVSVSCTDTAAPSVPAGLSATSTSASQINLSWSTSTDTGGSGLAGYKIYRCTGSSCTPTSQIATSTPVSYSDTGLSGSTAYTYAVSAYDNASNESAKSATTSATTQASADIQAPTITAFTMPATAASTTVAVSSFTATDNVGVTGYLITEASSTPSVSNPNWTGSAPASFHFGGSGSRTAYSWAKDAANNISTSTSTSVTITLPTYTIGGSISGLTGTVVLQDNGGDNLSTSTSGSFTFATALGGGAGYSVTVLTQPTGQTCTVTNGSGTVASANVTNVSVSCAPTVDSTPPSIPSGLSATAVSTTEIDLSWASSTDNVGVAGYDIYRNDGLIATTTSLSSADTGLAAGTTYRYYVAAFDAAGNVSATSTTATATTQSPAPSAGGGGGGGIVITPPTIILFSASPAGILAGQSSTLSWSLTGASSVSITPNVSKSNLNSLSGTATVTPSSTTIYTLAAGNTYGQSVTATVTVTVMASNAGLQPPLASGLDNLPLPSSSSPAYCLVNAAGTFSLILSGIRHGIANPGLLYSFGYSFSDAVTDTPAYQSLALGDLLWPDDGALVKAPGNPTVYLISGRAKHGFTSASVFLGLGYKFSSVLTIPAPQLNGLTTSSLASDRSARHLRGAQVSSHGTIYYLGETQRSPYPSLAVFNTWNLHNDFSRILPANAADLALPLGPLATPRSSCTGQ